MSTTYDEAVRLARSGLVVLPVKHGDLGPAIDWVQYRFINPRAEDLEEWFNQGTGVHNYPSPAPSRSPSSPLEGRGAVGLGVVCGQISGNLVVLEFSLPDAFRLWRIRNTDLAKKLPTMKGGESTYVFFRSKQPLGSGSMYLRGMEGPMAGRMHSEASFVVLPPTRFEDGRQRRWIDPRDPYGLPSESYLVVEEEEDAGSQVGQVGLVGPVGQGEGQGLGRGAGERRIRLPVLTLEEAGVTTRARPLQPHEILRRNADDGGLGVRRAEIEDASRFGRVFASVPEYVKGPGTNDLPWVVQDFLPETYLAILAGESKGGKSCLVTALSMSVATGEPFLGLPARKGAVLWVAFEESYEERIASLKTFETRPGNLYLTHEKLYIDSDEGIATLRWWVRKTGARLIVIDPLYGATNAESLADGRSARIALSRLKELCRIEKCAAIVLHHITKNVSLGMTRERFADSHQILAVASMDLLMEHFDKPDGSREIWLHGRGRGEFANQVWLIRSTGPAHFELVARGRESQMSGYRGDAVIVGAIRRCEKPVTADELADALGQNVRTLRNKLTEMVKAGLLVVTGKEGCASLYAAEGR
ncbi:MAG: AAA family ATPase [Fimbriimonadales bacterium]